MHGRRVTGSIIAGAFFIAFGILNLAVARKAVVQHTPIFFRHPLLVRGGTSMDPWQAIILGILLLALGLWLVLSALRNQRPPCDVSSVCLPRHPAMAYLFLVRW
jgi:hypothetical protein